MDAGLAAGAPSSAGWRWRSPTWAKVDFPQIDYQDAYYYAAPKTKDGPKSLDEVDPGLLAVYEKLGIPLKEQAVLAGVRGRAAATRWTRCSTASRVVTTFKKELAARSASSSAR